MFWLVGGNTSKMSPGQTDPQSVENKRHAQGNRKEGDDRGRTCTSTGWREVGDIIANHPYGEGITIV